MEKTVTLTKEEFIRGLMYSYRMGFRHQKELIVNIESYTPEEKAEKMRIAKEDFDCRFNEIFPRIEG